MKCRFLDLGLELHRHSVDPHSDWPKLELPRNGQKQSSLNGSPAQISIIKGIAAQHAPSLQHDSLKRVSNSSRNARAHIDKSAAVRNSLDRIHPRRVPTQSDPETALPRVKPSLCHVVARPERGATLHCRHHGRKTGLTYDDGCAADWPYPDYSSWYWRHRLVRQPGRRCETCDGRRSVRATCGEHSNDDDDYGWLRRSLRQTRGKHNDDCALRRPVWQLNGTGYHGHDKRWSVWAVNDADTAKRRGKLAVWGQPAAAANSTG